ncbi:MAG: hypothetical protein R2746_05215 [Acidimicrobiales bacterium]
MAPPIKKRRIVAGQPAAHQGGPGPLGLGAGVVHRVAGGGGTGGRVPRRRGIRARVDTGLKRHAAMNTVEVSHVSVPRTEVDLAVGLLEGRPDLFPGATSWSEPLRYRRGLWARVSQGGLAAQIGCVLFALAIVVPIVVTLIVSVLAS